MSLVNDQQGDLNKKIKVFKKEMMLSLDSRPNIQSVTQSFIHWSQSVSQFGIMQEIMLPIMFGKYEQDNKVTDTDDTSRSGGFVWKKSKKDGEKVVG